MSRILAILSGLALIATATVQSQTPVQKPRNAVDVLKAIHDQNAKLLDRQTDSLKKLDELEATAKIVKNLAARS